MITQIWYITTLVMTLVISIRESRHHKPWIKWFIILLILILITEITGFRCKMLELESQRYQFIYHLFTPIEYILLVNIYMNIFYNNTAKKLAKCSALIYVTYSIWNAFYGETYRQFPTVGCMIEWTLMLLLVLYYFYELYQSDLLMSIFKLPSFWMSTGNFFYYAGTLFIMGLIHKVEHENKELATKIFQLVLILNIFMYSFWIIGLLCNRQSRII